MKTEGIKGMLHSEIEQADERLLKLLYIMVKGYRGTEAPKPVKHLHADKGTIRTVFKREVA